MKTRWFLTLLLLVPFIPGYPQLLKKKPDYGLNLGTSFTTTSGYGSAITTFVSPHLSYSFNPRFRMTAGITLMNTQLIGAKPYYPIQSEQSFNGNFTDALLYVSGQYLLNDRLTVSGTAYKKFSLYDPAPVAGMTPYRNPEFQGFNIGLDYKAGENFHIQAGFGFTNGSNLYQPNSLYNPNPVYDPYFPW
jgi:hypothetical protein